MLAYPSVNDQYRKREAGSSDGWRDVGNKNSPRGGAEERWEYLVEDTETGMGVLRRWGQRRTVPTASEGRALALPANCVSSGAARLARKASESEPGLSQPRSRQREKLQSPRYSFRILPSALSFSADSLPHFQS